MGGPLYDLHIHSCLSPCGDADMTPGNIAGMAKLNGLRIAALTDHNTCLNCPAFFEACRVYGVVPIAGMELTTMEEIHVVCLFATLEKAMEFDRFVAGHRMKIKNRPDIFGEQIIMDVRDDPAGCVDELLILATDLDLMQAVREVRRFGGAAFPAHIDKQANGIIGILGDFPAEPGFVAAEFHDVGNISGYKAKYPILEGLTLLTNSDAHMLESMPIEPAVFSELEDDDNEQTLRRKIVAILGK